MAKGVRIVKSKTGGLISVQVWTDKLPGRPFPAWAVLIDINKDGKVVSKHAGAEKHREQVIASYKRTNK